jgi:hypothetical protein
MANKKHMTTDSTLTKLLDSLRTTNMPSLAQGGDPESSYGPAIAMHQTF